MADYSGLSGPNVIASVLERKRQYCRSEKENIIMKTEVRVIYFEDEERGHEPSSLILVL